MKIALYLRVSTDRQETLNQAVQLREFAKKRQWHIVREFKDSGESGAKRDRAALKQMFEDARCRKFDLLLFWSLDRLSREGVLPTLRYLETLTSYGVAWQSYTEQFFDSCGPFRDAIIGVMASLARQERIRLSERTKAGLQVARARGTVLGRPKCEIDLKILKRLRASGKSWRAIGATLKVSPATALHASRGV